jgi:outer membrane protein OmpA-like peptidoglycan-associated protein
LLVTAAHDAFEYDADRAALKALAGGRAEPAASKHGSALQRQLPATSPGPPTMQGPDWGLTCDILQGKCSFNTPAGDAPIEKEHYRCVLLAREGRCPPECEDELRPLGIPCVQPGKPRTPEKNPPTGGGPTLPQCPPGQIFISGKCFPFRPPDKTTPPLQEQSTPSRQFQLGGAPSAHVRTGTIESETMDNFTLNDPQVPPRYVDQLDHLAGLLNVYSNVEVHIEGHTDGSGTEAVNIPLSRQRAEAVKAQLIQRHVVNPTRLKTSGFSSHQPQVTPPAPTAQEPKNRRVEVWYYIPPSKPMGEGLRMDSKP